MITVTLVQTDGATRTLQNIKPGTTLMVAARDAGVAGILGDCGGGCACATCHVYVDPAWQTRVGPPDAIEDATLDMASDVRKPESRLSCQIILAEPLNGLTVHVAPMT